MTLLFLQKIIVLLKINTSVIIDWEMYCGIKYFVLTTKFTGIFQPTVTNGA